MKSCPYFFISLTFSTNCLNKEITLFLGESSSEAVPSKQRTASAKGLIKTPVFVPPNSLIYALPADSAFSRTSLLESATPRKTQGKVDSRYFSKLGHFAKHSNILNTPARSAAFSDVEQRGRTTDRKTCGM